MIVKVFEECCICSVLDGSDGCMSWSDSEVLGRRMWVHYVGRLQETGKGE